MNKDHQRMLDGLLEGKVPDLDHRSSEWLMSFWHLIHCHPVIAARRLFPDRPKGYVSATEALGAYAVNRATELSCVKRGDQQATDVYRECAACSIDGLETWARWS